jgi:hypothetical protein
VFGCAALGAISLGIASADQAPTQPAAGLAAENDKFVEFDAGMLKEQREKFMSTLASKLGVSTDKLQQALADAEKEVGPAPLLLGIGRDATGGKEFTISISSDLDVAARAIGISESQLRQELSGKSLTDLARAHNVDPQTVANALKSTRMTELDQAVQSGKLPTDVASRIKWNLDNEIKMLMSVVRAANGLPGKPDVHSFRVIIGGPGMQFDGESDD